MRKGYDCFISAPNGTVEMICKVCEEICDVERNVYDFVSWSGAMAHIKERHDLFSCPHGDEGWHKYALELMQDIEKCHSQTIKIIMQKDLNEILINKEIPSENK
jgi:hypothetical protein